MSKTMIDKMVDRFLIWKLPDDFGPDSSITFDREKAKQGPHCWPVGTNLLTADQAREMVKHMLAGALPSDTDTDGLCPELEETMDLTLALKGEYFDQIKAGTKTEEYRLVTPYWIRRLQGRNYKRLILTRGYPKRTDSGRRLVLPWRGVREVVITHPHFGTDPVAVYAINVGHNAE